MSKKLTIEFIRAEFAKKDYTLLTTEYKNNKQKLEYICPKGHRHLISWCKWRSGQRCLYCCGKIKLTIGYIKKQFEKEGYIFLTKIYENSEQKLNYVCPKGHYHFISWNSWRKGARCPYCYGNAKYTIEFIRSKFEKEGYELLTTVYEGAHQKLDYICFMGHRHHISYAAWRRGDRCPYCANNAKLNIEFIRAEFEKESYQLLTTVYENNLQRLKYICPKGHKHYIGWNNWVQGKRCSYCAGNAKLNIKFIQSEFAKEGYILLTEVYKNAYQKLNYICPKGHKHSTTWHNWESGARCPVCHYNNNFGPNHPNWKGGISCEPYCQDWTKEFKEFIKERDGYKCMNPDCWGTSKRLTIHHINYVKKDCSPENLITLCDSCNSRANKDREWHTSWYQTILQKRYGKDYIYAK